MTTRNNIITTMMLLALGFFALLPTAQAVVPAPDGGYPNRNTAEGTNALFSLTTGVDDTAIGFQALLYNRSGYDNTAIGSDALYRNTTGHDNTALGAGALSLNTIGVNNTAIGTNAGDNQTSGSNNVYIGVGINGIAGESDACRIASIFGQTAASGSAVFITSGHKLGTMTSSGRFKDEIKPMDKASDTLFSLKPVTFRYKREIDPQRIAQFGLVAEEVEKVNPNLVVRGKDGKPYSVRYEAVNAMLLNEFLKEHKKVEEQQGQITELNSRVARQEAIIARQGEGMELLAAQLNKQAAQIQKVSAQIELSSPVQTVASDQ
jgi:hypothetical protein